MTNRIYRLEWATNLQARVWTSVLGATNIVGTGGVVEVADRNGANAAARHYRVRLLW